MSSKSEESPRHQCETCNWYAEVHDYRRPLVSSAAGAHMREARDQRPRVDILHKEAARNLSFPSLERNCQEALLPTSVFC